jgi:hypothetical protein
MMKKWSLIVVAALLLVSVSAVWAQTPTYTENWDGRGTDSERCELAGQEGRPESGWIHWVFSTKGESTDAKLTLGGTGSGTYSPGEPLNAEVWHFYTPFFELEGLTATIELFGGDPARAAGWSFPTSARVGLRIWMSAKRLSLTSNASISGISPRKSRPITNMYI